MRKLDHVPDRCEHCGSGQIYVDKIDYAWCFNCDRSLGHVTSNLTIDSLFEPRWPGDAWAEPLSRWSAERLEAFAAYYESQTR